MAIGERETLKTSGPTRERCRYLFKAEQVLRMVEAGILPEDEKIELLDVVLYKITKGELHNEIVGAVADALRAITPAGYTVREEKSNRADERSMPEPDVAICQGARFTHLPDMPALETLALAVEVSDRTRTTDSIKKLAKYAAGCVPVYWIIDVAGRRVLVHREPETVGGVGRYGSLTTLKPGDALDVEVGGQVRGLIAVSDFFPPENQAHP